MTSLMKTTFCGLMLGLALVSPALAKDTAMNNSGPGMNATMQRQPGEMPPPKKLSAEEQKQVEALRATIKQQRAELKANYEKLHAITGEPPRHGWRHRQDGEQPDGMTPPPRRDMPPMDQDSEPPARQ